MMQSVRPDIVETQLLRVVPVKIGDQLCYPLFTSQHSKSRTTEEEFSSIQTERNHESVVQTYRQLQLCTRKTSF